ncbi:transcription factor RFX3 isoform X2 [Aricia agestis]|uniref:transcription factor RFX3 isoform X2 n=1 Tax=Aricia agestis TaxID=91739 RepID=UPI001C20801C|nr:transcription factor RFX3 isoform X2 [Aricia agestis]
MAARLAAPAQGAGGGASPSAVRELIVIPELPNTIHLQHAIHQVSNVEVNGDSSGQSSPSTEAQHTYIVAKREWTPAPVKIEQDSDPESEGGTGVNYHVQYVESQEIYTQPGPQPQMETLRTYPVYSVEGGEGGAGEWCELYAAPERPASPASPAPTRMPPATVQWLLEHYETAEGVSLPRSTLYAHYLRHCGAHRLEPVNAASFGKLIRSVFVGLRTRRLGTRGNSKYHYYGIRAKPAADLPYKPDAPAEDPPIQDDKEGRAGSADTAAAAAAASAHSEYLGAVVPPDPPELHITDLPDDLPPDCLQMLRDQHRSHGAEFLAAVAALDTSGVERARRGFWRRGRRVLWRLAARRDVCAWLRRADLRLYQRAVDLLLPDVLRPIPPALTQSIRNFAKGLEAALAAGGAGAPARAARAAAAAAGALAAALRRYTSLNHLAQAARAVLNNQHQIQQMLSDLNRVDFRVVREQATWACAAGSAAAAHRLEADFKSSFAATLGRGLGLEAWAAWLEGCVRAALAPHEPAPPARSERYVPRARRLLLDWSFYSSLVIRELTLRSAASFGSFHLIRLLYDEYVSFLIERRVAAHDRRAPIAVMRRDEDDEEGEGECGSGGDGEGGEGGEGEADGADGECDEPEDEWDWGDDDDEPDLKRARLDD